MGVNFHVTDLTVARAAMEPSTYAPTPQTPLTLRVLLHWDALARNENTFVAWIACIWLLLVQGVLRFAHVQRSKVMELTRDAIIGRAGLGKSKRCGRRAPFWWAAPRYSLSHADVGQRLASLQEAAGYTRSSADTPAWLLFDFAPPRAPIGEVSSLAPRKMGLSRFQRFSCHLLTAAPASLEPWEAESMANSYGGRRLYPTLGGLRGFVPDERVKLGGWLDAEARECAKQVSIADRYNQHLLNSQLKVKKELTDTLNELWTRMLDQCSSTFHLLDADWPTVMEQCRSRKWIQKRYQDATFNRPPLVTQQPPLAPVGLLEDVPRDSRGSPADTSDSDESVKPSERVGSSTDSSSSAYSLKDLDEIQWLCSRGKSGHVHLAGEVHRGRLYTACGRCLQSPHVGVGVTAREAAEAAWSPRCWGRLPAVARRAILAEAPHRAPVMCVLGLQPQHSTAKSHTVAGA